MAVAVVEAAAVMMMAVAVVSAVVQMIGQVKMKQHQRKRKVLLRIYGVVALIQVERLSAFLAQNDCDLDTWP